MQSRRMEYVLLAPQSNRSSVEPICFRKVFGVNEQELKMEMKTAIKALRVVAQGFSSPILRQRIPSSVSMARLLDTPLEHIIIRALDNHFDFDCFEYSTVWQPKWQDVSSFIARPYRK